MLWRPLSHPLTHPPLDSRLALLFLTVRDGNRVGDFSSCGDLLFSGHAAFTTLTMLVFVKSWRGHATYRVWKVLGVVYLLTMCTLAIAGRKHYTVSFVGCLREIGYWAWGWVYTCYRL